MANGMVAASNIPSKQNKNHSGIRSLISKLAGRQQSRYNDESAVSVMHKDNGRDIRSPSALNFRIFPANGGYIVEFYRYDNKRDETSTKLYVIPSSEELTETISSICQQEFLQL